MSEKIKTYEPSGNDVIRRFREYNDLLWQINVETLTADKVLTAGTDDPIQYFTSTANRNITLSTTGAENGDWFLIHAISVSVGNYLTVTGLTSTILYDGHQILCVFDGTYWRFIDYRQKEGGGGLALGSCDPIMGGTTFNNWICFGSGSDILGDDGIAIGQLSTAGGSGVSIGKDSIGGSVSVVVGSGATESGVAGVSIGVGATSTKRNSVALGRQAICEQTNTCSFTTDDESARSYIPNWYAENTNPQNIEIYLGGTPSERLELPDQTFVMTWDLQVSAIDYDTDLYHAGFHLIGTARFDGGTNNQILNSNWSTTDHVLYRPSTDIDIEPFVDNTYEALRLRVTAYNSSPEIVYAMRWHVTGQVSVVLA